jgi:hypothetical protein
MFDQGAQTPVGFHLGRIWLKLCEYVQRFEIGRPEINSPARNEWLRRSPCDREQVKSVVRWISAADLVAERTSSGQCSVNARKLLDLVNERDKPRSG